MKTKLLFLFTFGVLASTIGARAQLVADGDTKIIDGTTTNVTGNLTIGTNGSFTTLVITNSGVVSSTGEGRLGFNATSKSNRVTVTDAGSRWSSLGSGLYLGYAGAGNQLVLTNGGVVINNDYANIGLNPSSSNNLAVVTDLGSLWTNRYDLILGFNATGNQLIISNGGMVANEDGYVGYFSAAGSNNLAMVTGPNSVWTNQSNLYIGVQNGGGGNRLVVSNGGVVASSFGLMQSSSNTVVVTGTGSLWTNRLDFANYGIGNQLVVSNGGMMVNGNGSLGFGAGARSQLVTVTDTNSLWRNWLNLVIGLSDASNKLVVSNGGTVMAANLILGSSAPATNNAVTLSGGNIIVTNASGTSLVDVRRGGLVLNSGVLTTDRLHLTNGPLSVIAFNGGILQTRQTTDLSGSPFVVGNSTDLAILELVGNGNHGFSSSLQIASNAVLKGSGTVQGNIIIGMGATLAPGSSIGRLAVAGDLVLSPDSTAFFELDQVSGTNDTVVGLTQVAYGGTLQLTNLNGTLTNGSAFKLFDATSYTGAFSGVLPLTPGPDLVWDTSGLTVDGILRVGGPNNTPEVTAPIPNQASAYGSAFNYTFPTNTFSDPDAGQVLSYTAGNLPPGITFDGPSRTFSGTPTTVGSNSVMVTATDNGSPPLSTNDTFDIGISKAPLTATAQNQSRSYGETNPLLTIDYVGFAFSDTPAVLDTQPVASTSADKNSSVGPYTITLTGGADDQYDITLVNGTLTVTNAPLTVTANSTNRPYGTANPDLTGSLTGVVNGENITASFSTIATNNSPPGDYPITPTLQDPDTRLGNYSVTTNFGTLTVDGVTISASTVGGSPTFCWPTNAADFVLEFADSLTPPVSWNAVTSGIATNDSTICYAPTPGPTTPVRFYRLHLP